MRRPLAPASGRVWAAHCRARPYPGVPRRSTTRPRTSAAGRAMRSFPQESMLRRDTNRRGALCDSSISARRREAAACRRHPTSDIRHPTSNIQHRTSDSLENAAPLQPPSPKGADARSAAGGFASAARQAHPPPACRAAHIPHGHCVAVAPFVEGGCATPSLRPARTLFTDVDRHTFQKTDSRGPIPENRL